MTTNKKYAEAISSFDEVSNRVLEIQETLAEIEARCEENRIMQQGSNPDRLANARQKLIDAEKAIDDVQRALAAEYAIALGV